MPFGGLVACLVLLVLGLARAPLVFSSLGGLLPSCLWGSGGPGCRFGSAGLGLAVAPLVWVLGGTSFGCPRPFLLWAFGRPGGLFGLLVWAWLSLPCFGFLGVRPSGASGPFFCGFSGWPGGLFGSVGLGLAVAPAPLDSWGCIRWGPLALLVCGPLGHPVACSVRSVWVWPSLPCFGFLGLRPLVASCSPLVGLWVVRWSGWSGRFGPG